MAGQAYVGTSGWSYGSWKEDFYAGVPQRRWLPFCAEHFTAIEVNATFYRLQKRQTFERWRDETPEQFRFAIKGNRYLTHNRKLTNPVSSIKLERERALGLGKKLAAVLWQLPSRFKKNLPRLHAFCEALAVWPETRHVMEFRDPSWFDSEVADCLHEHRIAACLSDAADWPLWDVVTTDLVYIRLHGHTRTYASAYSHEALQSWAARVRRCLQQGDVHVYFDNDAEGAAPFDAIQLLQLVRSDSATKADQHARP